MEGFLNEGYVSGARLCWGSMSDPSTTKGQRSWVGQGRKVKIWMKSIDILLLTKHLEN